MVNLRSNPKANDIVTIRGRTAWFEEPLHARFKRVPVPQRRERREGTQEDSLTYITLTFDQPPRDGTPWYSIGRDPNKTDINIDPEVKSISSRHLKLGFDDWGQVVLKDISTNGTTVTYHHMKLDEFADPSRSRKESQRITTVSGIENVSTWVVPVGWTVEVVLVGATLVFEAPDHTDYLDDYRQRVEVFKTSHNNPVPFLGGLSLNDQRATTIALFSEARAVVRAAAQAAADDGDENGKRGRYAWIVSDRRLGGGTYGDVYEVFNTTNWCMCAGKRIEEDDIVGVEWEILKQLDHKHIVRCVDVEERRQRSPSMIVMEYLKLGDLSNQRQIKAFSEPDIIKIIAQVADALAYLHEKKITHRDLKTNNILVRSRDPVEVVVADFGLSKSGATLMQSRRGTLEFMAPEVEEDDPIYDNKADMWSLAIVALDLLPHGRPDFGTKRGYATRVWSDRDALVGQFDNKGFARLIRSLLVLDPAQRPGSKEFFKDVSLLLPQTTDVGDPPKETVRQKEKDPAEGVVDGCAATVVRTTKRVRSDASTIKPPTKKPALSKLSASQSAVTTQSEGGSVYAPPSTSTPSAYV